MAKEQNSLEKWAEVLDELADQEQLANKKWNEENKPLKEVIIDEHQVMGIWSNPISGYWYGYRSTKGVYQIRSVIQLPRQLWEFIVENEKRIQNLTT